MKQLTGIGLIFLGGICYLLLMIGSRRLHRSQFASLLFVAVMAISFVGGVALIVTGAS